MYYICVIAKRMLIQYVHIEVYYDKNYTFVVSSGSDYVNYTFFLNTVYVVELTHARESLNYSLTIQKDAETI